MTRTLLVHLWDSQPHHRVAKEVCYPQIRSALYTTTAVDTRRTIWSIRRRQYRTLPVNQEWGTLSPLQTICQCLRTMNDKTTFLQKNWVSQNVMKRGLHTIRRRPQFSRMCVAVFCEILTNLMNHSLHTIRVSHKFRPFVLFSLLFANSV